MLRRAFAAGSAVALLNLATLGVLIGWAGGSRAYGTGLHTLFRDHLAAVMVSWLVALVIAWLAGRGLRAWSAVGRLLAGAVVGDVVAGLIVAAGIGEITYLDLPRVLFVETVAGTQLAMIAIGAIVGFASSGAARRRPWLVSRR